MNTEDFRDEADHGVEPLEAEDEEAGVKPLDAEVDEDAELEDEWEDEEAYGAEE